MTEDTEVSGPEETVSARHLLDWGPPPGPKGGLADRKEVVVERVREGWKNFIKTDVPAVIAVLLIQWAERRSPGDEPLPVIANALKDAASDPDTRDGFDLAYRILLARNATLPADQLEQVGPIPDIIVQGASLPRNCKPGGQPKPDRRKWLAIEVARASWVAGLTPTRNDTNEPEPDTPDNDLPSAADLVARATGLSYWSIVRAWSRKIDDRSPSYLLERWEREANEAG